MRPDAETFSPRESPLASSDGTFAVVPYTAVNQAEQNATLPAIYHLSFEDTKATPHRTIVNESVKGLLGEVVKLNLRCEALEAANKELKDAMATLKRDFTTETPAAHTTTNLTGNDSSDSGANDEQERSITPEVLENLVKEVDLIKKILAGFAEKIDALDAQQKDMKAYFTYDVQDKKTVKERVEALERDLTSLKDVQEAASIDLSTNLKANAATSTGVVGDVEHMKYAITDIQKSIRNLESKTQSKGGDAYGLDRLDETDDTYYSEPASSKFEMTTYFTDQLEAVTRELNKMKAEGVTTIDELRTKVEVLTAAVEGGGAEPKAQDWGFNSSKGKPAKASKQDVVDLKLWQGEKVRLDKNGQLIDEASTRDALYAMFFQLSAIMERAGGYAMWEEGPFLATSEEAFQLRDRVLCRLALFDRYAEVLKEAQDQEGKIIW